MLHSNQLHSQTKISAICRAKKQQWTLTQTETGSSVAIAMNPTAFRLNVGWLPFIAMLGGVSACSKTQRDYGSDVSIGGGTYSDSAVGGSTSKLSSGVGGTNSVSSKVGGTSILSSGGSGAPLGSTGGTSSGSGGDSPVGGASATSLSDGKACLANAECTSQLCVDGVCCKTTCTGCNACSNALTGQASGTCAPVISGKDPHDACADETATNQCGNDGMCDGKGACQKTSSAHICKTAGCSSDGKTFTPATTCNVDGSGVCTVATPQDCAGYPCTVTGCSKPCAANADCPTGNYCDMTTGKCATRKPNGATAVNTYECTSGFVSDGVCCNAACTGQCQSCKQTVGTCKAVTTPRASCGGSGTCGTKKCDGVSPDCVFPGSEVSCPATCSSDLLSTLTSTCNAGACGTAASTACGSFYYCATGQCTAKLPNNTAGCTGNVTCSSGNCSTATSGSMCCGGGLTNCSQGCYNLTNDAKHCGTCAGDCGPNYSCNSSICTCSGNKLSCGTCAKWAFESNTTEGWIQSPLATNVPIPTVKPTPPNNPFSGKYSLAITLSQQTFGSFVIPLCPNVGTMATVSGFSFWVYVDGPDYAGTKQQIVATTFADGSQADGASLSRAPYTWVRNENTFSGSNGANYLEIRFSSQTPWTGTIYVDDISLTP